MPHRDESALTQLKITHRSLTNPRRRLPELRRTHSRLRSLTRGRFAGRITAKRLPGNPGELVIIQLLRHVTEFLDCTFQDHTSAESPVLHAYDKLRRSIRQLERECHKVSEHGGKVSSTTIKIFGRSTRRLYKAARHSRINLHCDKPWRDLGLCAHILFK